MQRLYDLWYLESVTRLEVGKRYSWPPGLSKRFLAAPPAAFESWEKGGGKSGGVRGPMPGNQSSASG